VIREWQLEAAPTPSQAHIRGDGRASCAEVVGRAYGAQPSSIQSLKNANRSGGQGSSQGMLPSAKLA
jgi:hypothetical protein